jgi:23S rRNA (adenine2503-C2)-methyltransferase
VTALDLSESPPELRGLLPDELVRWVASAGAPAYRAEQIFRWLHGSGAESLDAMTNVPPALRAALEREHWTTPLALDAVQTAADGTRKLRFRTHDGQAIESVLIPDEDRERDKLTLCISSQVGCALGCGFCATATLGFTRHLRAGEIVEQVYRATALAGRRPTNLVFMGMGEPLHNFDHVARALTLLQHPWGATFSPRRITISTSGLVSGIEKLAALSPAPNLAISLNATTDEVRDRIMPVNKRWPIAALLKAASQFPLAHGRRVTFEYVLLAGVNDSDADADRLPRLLRGIPAKVNLIPWNPFVMGTLEGSPSPAPSPPAMGPTLRGVPERIRARGTDQSPAGSHAIGGPGFTRPAAERIRTFQERVRAAGIAVYIRTPRGDDIDAACGQLAARDLVTLRPWQPTTI